MSVNVNNLNFCQRNCAGPAALTTESVLVIGPPSGLNVPPSWFSMEVPSWPAGMPGMSMLCSWYWWCAADLEGDSMGLYGPEEELCGPGWGIMWSGKVGGVMGGMLKSSSLNPLTG